MDRSTEEGWSALVHSFSYTPSAALQDFRWPNSKPPRNRTKLKRKPAAHLNRARATRPERGCLAQAPCRLAECPTVQDGQSGIRQVRNIEGVEELAEHHEPGPFFDREFPGDAKVLNKNRRAQGVLRRQIQPRSSSSV